MIGYELVFQGNVRGKIFRSYEEAESYAFEFNSIGRYYVPYIIRKI